MTIKDVRKVLDIPEIEDYLQTVFTLNLYEVGDKTIIYESMLPNNYMVSIEIISDESLIEGTLDLTEILSYYNIQFFQWVIFNDLDKAVQGFMYRPAMDDCDKDFY